MEGPQRTAFARAVCTVTELQETRPTFSRSFVIKEAKSCQLSSTPYFTLKEKCPSWPGGSLQNVISDQEDDQRQANITVGGSWRQLVDIYGLGEVSELTTHTCPS